MASTPLVDLPAEPVDRFTFTIWHALDGDVYKEVSTYFVDAPASDAWPGDEWRATFPRVIDQWVFEGPLGGGRRPRWANVPTTSERSYGSSMFRTELEARQAVFDRLTAHYAHLTKELAEVDRLATETALRIAALKEPA